MLFVEVARTMINRENNKDCVTFFASGGLFTMGARQAGLRAAGAIEINEKYAEIYRINHGNNIKVEDIRTFDFTKYDRWRKCWLLQASPPCKNSSRSKRHADETAKVIATETDLELALSVCRGLEFIKPQNFLLENVTDYATTDAYKVIIKTLSKMGYALKQLRLNSADFGVPQSRERLYVVASLNRELIEGFDLSPYYTRSARIGWYAGIERHLSTCKQKTLAEYQVKAIAASMQSGKIAPNDIAALVGGAGSNPNQPGVTHYAAPSPTVRACEGLRSGGWRPCIVKQADFTKPLGEAVGYKLSSRCLLALQGVPDSFLVGREVVTGFVAGNGVSVPVARAICGALFVAENRARVIAESVT